ncbi:MAG: M3 family oligoendopeptidase [Crocinitomicaceae bacterium]|nr:M3 family oligoendopeptidase [Crocinitomicaceae bacterium]
MKINAPKRTFIAADLNLQTWEDIQSYFIDLRDRKISSQAEFEKWLQDRSELDAVLEENAAWRYIKMTIDTRIPELTEAYTYFVTEIQPKLAPFEDLLNRKMMESEYISNLSESKEYSLLFKRVQQDLDLFQEKNIALDAEISEQSQEFGAISAAQMIEIDGEKMTMQKASVLLKNQDEAIRKQAFELMGERRLQDAEKLDDLFTALITKRHQLAVNAGFDNYRDYKLKSLGRFDYTKEDCFDFHDSIQKHIVPLVKKIQQKQADLLGVEKIKPWNLEVDPLGKAALKPFENGEELLNGTINMFDKIDTYFGDCIRTMNEMGHLDLESKLGKSPGGYNYPLYEIGVPFIFMNAVGTLRDLVTMVHEGGHAIHSFLSRDLKLTGFKNLPSEVAELASMSMELLSMEQWDEFFPNQEELKRAKIEQLETILKILPWIATIDKFQHWIYENPTHAVDERQQKWEEITSDYGTGLVDWNGYEQYKVRAWQRQLHLYEVPFYYIEYGIAQLGALAIWKNSKTNHQEAIEGYKNALTLGYTRAIPEIYETAGIKFDFSDSYLKEIATFVEAELEKVEQGKV